MTLGSLYENKVKWSAFDMEMIFHSRANKTHFHKKGCALGLILKVGVFGTQKWPVRCKKCSEQTPLTKKKKKNLSKRHIMKVNALVVKQPLYSGKVILSVGKHLSGRC